MLGLEIPFQIKTIARIGADAMVSDRITAPSHFLFSLGERLTPLSIEIVIAEASSIR